MPLYHMPPGFGGDCHVHPNGRRHPFHHHTHHHGPPHPPHMRPMFGRRGPHPRFIAMHVNNKDPNNETTADDTNGAESNPWSDANQHPWGKWHYHGRHHGRRHRGGPRGNCSNLPRESPLEEGTKTEQPEQEEDFHPPFFGPPPHHGFHRHGPPGPPRFHRNHHRHMQKNRLMLLSLLHEQQRAMQEHEQNHEKNQDSNATHETTSHPAPSAPKESCIMQAPQNWHVEETDNSLILSIDVAGFRLENLELKVEHGVLTLFGKRTNRLGDVFDLRRSKTIDPIMYDEAGIEARCDTNQGINNVDDADILRITVPKREYPRQNDEIPIRVAKESSTPGEAGKEEPVSTAETTAPVAGAEESTERELASENPSDCLQDSIFVPEAEIVSEQDVLATNQEIQVETVQDGDSLIAPEELSSAAENDNATSRTETSSDTNQSWEDLVVDGKE
mmetsp:Transcript_28549/g.69190  ORF Transcript_28549/g.69190 Transcript_28549/m.69190 type:complete len:446 (-) Transcript_28549:101-1438(-)|eukprot:CAMPEP_0113626162 /NCGR_PEP_ID=MMETSP0017_2-20120614/13526_1 /TAXON_ID=2856 /ORGANISM="Cylindrotheca closterium" /LENGTH=445 /DNA_ID=CAMNT_0000536325 /DNA_START=94 /DNA_END=1431 /DNA_ORIENTATION=+ /assembly_acc=CAM_ASM_000147